MARKTKVYTVEDESRDKGKTFVITEMSANRAERWAARALLALGRAGIDLPDDLVGGGMAGIAVAGIYALMRVEFHDAEPLLDEMMTCVQYVPDPAKRSTETGQPYGRPLMTDDDVEEVSTLFNLRREVIELHTGFSLAAALSRQTTVATTEQVSSSPTTQTSHQPSLPSSPAA